MLYVVRFYDKADVLELRQTHRAAHLDWLADNAGVILQAGALNDPDRQSPQGALWILETRCLEVVKELIEADPFYRAGIREHYEISAWNKAFAERRALI